MPPSRREFLRATGIAAGVSLIPSGARAALIPTEDPSPRVKGLLFDASDLPRIRRAVRHPRVVPYWQSLVNANLDADAKFLRESVRFNNHVKDMLQVRQILERTSFVFAVTGDRKQGEVALAAANKILEYPKWDYFLEGGEEVIGLQRAPEATIAMSCAREWLGPLLNTETAAEIEKQIAEKGAPACYRTLYGMKYPDRVRGWGFDPEDDYPYRFDLSRWPFILNATNLKVIPIAGLGLAGCLLRGKHPQAERWIDMAVQSAKAFAPMFGPDGAYDEGVGYWGYTASHLTLLVEAVRRTQRTDLSTIINYPGTVRYGLSMAMPLPDRPNDCVNFGDAWNMGDVAVAAWVARRFKDSIAQYVATEVGQLTSHFSIIWLDPDLPVRKPGPDQLDVRFSDDWVVSRSGWKPTDGLVALRSGGPANHEHADRNSIIFKAYGERLFHDPYRAAYAYTDPHWILRLTSAHTAVLIDGKGHQYHNGHEGTNASWAEARILDYSHSTKAMTVTSDATDAYRLVNNNIALVQRTLVFLKPDVLLLFDRVQLQGDPLPVQLRFQVDNSDGKGTVNAEGASFGVQRPLANLQAAISGSQAVTVRTASHNLPPDKGIHPYAEAESAPANEHMILTVCTAQKTGGEHGTLSVTREKETWNVKGSHNGRQIDVSIDPRTPVPKIVIG
ncbi:MAG: heparinase II/III family protein [Bacteroidota bacterium]